MKKIIQLLLSAMFVSNIASAQSFAINTDGSTANTSALLDVKSTTRGLLIPRMSKIERNGIPAPATGLLVFQNAPDSAGFYYYDGSKWNWMAAINGNADSLAWKRNGNAGTNAAVNFIGTTDNRVLNFRVNNIKSGLIDNVSYNSALGFSGLLNNSSGTHNTAIGFQSMTSNTTGNYNTSVGAFSFYTNTTGIRNTAIGTSALYFNNANDNTAVGYESLNQASSVSATNNTAIGSNALRQNVSGNRNIAIGAYSLYQLISDSLNIVIGDSAAYAAKASRNVIIGAKSAKSLLTGNSNTIIGDNTANKFTSASNNVLIGDNVGRLATSNPFNAVVIGSQAGDTSIANWSTVVGNLAGRKNTVWGNTMIGSSAGENTTTGTVTLVGDNAGKNNTTGILTALGSYAGYSNTTGGLTALGSYAGYGNTTGGSNTFSGYNSGLNNSTGSFNTFTGAFSGRSNITGHHNSFYGDNAGNFIRFSNSTALFGNYAMGLSCDTSNYNSAFGIFAAQAFSKGDKNSFFGYNIVNSLKVGNENTVLGYQASVGDTADLNVTIGSFAGSKGDENVFIGHDAGKHNNTASMDGSTFVGSWAGFFKRASYSLLLGYSSTVLSDGYNNASAIGAFSRVDTSNAMVLGSTGVNVGIGITKPYQAKLTVAGPGNTLGIFGLGQAGISLQQNGPTIGYNQYRDVSAGNATRYMANGYAWVNYMDQGSGNMYWNSMPSGTANAAGGVETMRMAMTNTGSLGLNVVPNGNGQLQFQNTLDNRKIVLWENANTTIDFFGFGINSGTLRYQVPAAGNVHSFVAGNTALLNIFGTGNATLAGTLTQLSDARLKENIVPINSTINDINKINAYHYYWKDENKDRDQQIGLLAQEVEAVFPQLVKKDAAGFLSVNYSGFVPLLIKGMQEQQTIIEKQQQQIDFLLKEMQEIKQEIKR